MTSRKLARLSAFIAIAIGTSDLLGWLFGIGALTSIVSSWPKMAPLTGVSFILCGWALYAALPATAETKTPTERSPLRRWLATGCATAVALVGLLKLTELWMGWNLGLDCLGFSESPVTTAPARLAPASALEFLLLGCALLLPYAYFRAYQGLAIAVGIVGWLGLSQYVFGGEPLSSHSKMAAHTALTFIVLSVGTLCLRPQKGLVELFTDDTAGGMTMRRLVPSIFIVSIGVAWLRLQGQLAGWYGTEAGLSIFSVANIIIFGGLIWATAALLRRSELERKAAESLAARGEAANARLAAIVESSDDAVIGKDLGRIVTSWNKGAERLFGYSSNEMMGTSIERLIPEDRKQDEDRILEKVARGESVKHFETLRKTKDGQLLNVSVTISPIKDASGRVIGVSKVARDITERKQSELRIQHLNRVYAVLSDINQTIVREKNPQAMLNAACRIAVEKGRFQTAWIGLLSETNTLRLEAYAGAAEDYAEKLRKSLAGKDGKEAPALRAVESGQPVIINNIENHPFNAAWRASELPLNFRAMAAFPIYANGRAVGSLNLFADEAGFFDDDEARLLAELTMDIGFALDVSRQETERVRADEARKASEASYRTLFEYAPDGIVIADPDSYYIDANASICRMLGYTREELIGLHASDIVAPAEVPQIDLALNTIKSKTDYHREWRFRRKDGTFFEAEVMATMMPDGNLLGMIRDITANRLLEGQLRQAQKMEAIGQLAGGVAHDFNNLLTVINGRSQLSMTRFKPGDVTRSDFELIYKTGERAAGLTRQLLAFSRQQMLEPVVLDLKALTADMDSMLRRLIREDIDFSTVLDPALKPVKADPGQLEQVLVNLVVNARDAMPGGGKLTIEAANVVLDDMYCRTHSEAKPGHYVMLAVSDTGHGMDEIIKSRIFEPFYTTKPQGKGTGLGLAMVFGVVKQSNGHIEVYSEIDKGTTFKVYLPQSNELMTLSESESHALTTAARQEVVLLVEDEPGVREVIRDLLEMNGYKVHCARNGIEALKICEQHKDTIHLLVTDVVMPEMGGPELVERMKVLHPETKALFTSGYTDHAVVRNGALTADVAFIQKPFTPANLARKVRDVLDKDGKTKPS